MVAKEEVENEKLESTSSDGDDEWKGMTAPPEQEARRS